jgi:NAD-dependent dihydropyrimidine dehydrogenase PreA subunit
MAEVKIEEQGCRGCTLCSDICPVDVFEFDSSTNEAKVVNTENCIGCLSCAYLCPSSCIEIKDVKMVYPFHRIDHGVRLVNKFLQTESLDRSIPEELLVAAEKEVGLLLTAMSDSINEILGRGHKSAGRRAGALAAAHLPELYSQSGLEDVLGKMQKKFGASFKFKYEITGDMVTFTAAPCGLLSALEHAGQNPGKSELCTLFHEYWAGLVSAFTGVKYICETASAGSQCVVKLKPQFG